MPPSASTILIADDEVDIRALLRVLLERDGYNIVEARDGEEAVAACQQHMPDIVLMDILMPVLDGAAACAKIQALPDGDRLPVLMITALSDKQSIDRCFDAGATDYLTKPINNQVLRRRVRRLLRTRQAEEALRANEARLASIINTATDAIILADDAQHITLFNPAAERLFGWTAAAISGQPVTQLIPDFGEVLHVEALQAAGSSAGRLPDEYLQSSGQRQDGTQFPIEVSLGRFEQDQETVLTITVRDITRRKQAAAEIERRVQQLASLAQMGQMVTTQLDLDEVLKAVIDQVMLRLAAEGVSVLLKDAPGQLMFAAVNGASADTLRGTHIPADVGIAGEVLRTGQSLRVRTAEDRARIYRAIETVSYYHAQDVVGVPLKLGSEILGVMEAVHSQPRVFTDDDLRLLESAGSWAAIALGNARQHQRLQRRLRESEAMTAISRALNETLDLDHVLQLIVTSVRQIIPRASVASFLAIDETQQMVYAVTEHGRSSDYRGRDFLRMNDQPLKALIEQGQVINILDLQKADLPWPAGIAPNIRAVLAVPVQAGTQHFGALSAQSVEARAFDADDERLLTRLSIEAAIAIQNARLYQSEHTQRELAEALRDTAAAITSTIDLDDVLDQILDNVGRVVPHDAANIMLVEAGVAHVARWRGYDRAANDQLRARRFSVADTWQLRQIDELRGPLVIADTSELSDGMTLPGSRAVQSFIGAPIRIKRILRGFINLESTTAGFFKAEYADRLQTFANQAAAALENARLYQLEQKDFHRIQETQLAALQSEKMEALGRLASALAQAIEKPLPAIRQLLQHPAADPVQREREWQQAGREIDRLEQIARDVVKFTQPETEPRLEISVNELIEQAVAQARALAAPDQGRVVTEWTTRPPIYVAPQQVTQVFFYLIENAIEAAGARGQVYVATQHDGDHVVATLYDDGPAIAPDDMPHIFEPFYTTKQHSAGLGLAISHNIIQQQGGTLTAENVTKERGAMFVVRLPAKSS